MRAPLVVGQPKRCPQCAELVQGAAHVCRYCAHNFAAAHAPVAVQRVEVTHRRAPKLGCLGFLVVAGIAYEPLHAIGLSDNTAGGAAMVIAVITSALVAGR